MSITTAYTDSASYESWQSDPSTRTAVQPWDRYVPFSGSVSTTAADLINIFSDDEVWSLKSLISAGLFTGTLFFWLMIFVGVFSDDGIYEAKPEISNQIKIDLSRI